MVAKNIVALVLLLSVWGGTCQGGEVNLCENAEECKIGVKTVVYFDKGRERPIITELFYPYGRGGAIIKSNSNNFRVLQQRTYDMIEQSEKKLPLVVFSHGYMGDRYSMAWLAEILAANGYIVAAPDHFGNTYYLQRAEDSLKRWDRPKDISYVVDQLLEDPLFKQHIDPEKIGFVGYSLGGLTGVWLAGGIADQYPVPNMATSPLNELDYGSTQEIIDSIDFAKTGKSYYDERIKAELLLAPAYGQAFTVSGLSAIKIPMMIVSVEDDKVAPLAVNGQYLADNVRSAGLKKLAGMAGHFVFLNKAQDKYGEKLPADFTKDEAGVDREKIHQEVALLAVKFFDKYLKGRSEKK